MSYLLYVGETTRHFGTRVREHLLSDCNYLLKIFRVLSRVRTYALLFFFSILDSALTHFHLKIKEALDIGPLHDPVTWYKIKYTGEQVAQWDFQNKGRSRRTGTSCFVLEVPLCNLLTSIFSFVPCDRIVQRAY